MEFKPIKTNKVYEQVIEQIKNLIYEGKLARGDKLPSERELKNKLKVSRASIREAFSALEMFGLIQSKPGEGTFIKRSFEGDLVDPLFLILLLNENVVEELLELRKVLEVDCVRLAAKRASDDDIKKLEVYVDKLLLSSGYEQKSIEADRMFHYTIAKASGNKVLYFVMKSISEAMDFHIKNTRTKLVSKRETMENFVQQHRLIFEAVKNRDCKCAMDAMKEHLNYVEKLINKEVEG